MNDNKIVYKLTKNDKTLVGSTDELKPYFNRSIITDVANAYYRGGRCHGYDVERIGVYQKMYDVYDNGTPVFRGTLNEICDYLHITPVRVTQIAKQGTKTLKRYTVIQNGKQFAVCPEITR